MKIYTNCCGITLLFSLLFALGARATVIVPLPFTDHMVLQRKMPVPVWGTADAGEKVTVTFNGQTKTATAGDDKNWRVVFNPMKEAGPLDMTIAGSTAVTLTDIYVGEVWNCAGQSNVDLTLNNTSQFGTRFADTIKNANLPLLRYVNMRQPGNPHIAWRVITPESAGGCSATSFFFGKEILKSVNCAVGLIVTAVGGTLIESWFDKATVAADPNMPTTKDKKTGKGVVAGSLYNQFVAPVVGYGIKGTMWIQGEQNTYDTVFTPQYAKQFKMIVTGWRKAWGQGDFPFYYGQLSSERPNKPGVIMDSLAFVAMVREAQREMLSLPNTAMAVMCDFKSGGWHYPQKPEAGYRLSLPAKALLYGQKNLEYEGPMYKNIKIKNGKATLTFTHTGAGLQAKDGDLTGFVIAGKDHKWYPATATIVGNTVEVSSPSVTEPAEVRYNWYDRTSGMGNLYNKDGLPASPFRSDVTL